MLVKEMQSFRQYYEDVIQHVDGLVGELEIKIQAMAQLGFVLSIGQLENSRRFKLVQSDADVCILTCLVLWPFYGLGGAAIWLCLQRQGLLSESCLRKASMGTMWIHQRWRTR